MVWNSSSVDVIKVCNSLLIGSDAFFILCLFYILSSVEVFVKL